MSQGRNDSGSNKKQQKHEMKDQIKENWKANESDEMIDEQDMSSLARFNHPLPILKQNVTPTKEVS